MNVTLCLDKHNAEQRLVATLRGISVLAGYAAADAKDSVCPTYSVHEVLGVLGGLQENALWLAGELDAVRARQRFDLDAAAERQCAAGCNAKREPDTQEGGKA